MFKLKEVQNQRGPEPDAEAAPNIDEKPLVAGFAVAQNCVPSGQYKTLLKMIEHVHRLIEMGRNSIRHHSEDPRCEHSKQLTPPKNISRGLTTASFRRGGPNVTRRKRVLNIDALLAVEQVLQALLGFSSPKMHVSSRAATCAQRAPQRAVVSVWTCDVCRASTQSTSHVKNRTINCRIT